jgi:hypothetical protein
MKLKKRIVIRYSETLMQRRLIFEEYAESASANPGAVIEIVHNEQEASGEELVKLDL